MMVGFWRRLLRRPSAVVALAVLAVIVAVTLLADVLSSWGTEQQDIRHAFELPSARHWLGTGQLGKDVFSRLAHGGRVTLTGVLISVAVYALVGIVLGMLAGFVGGRVDAALMRLADLVVAVPVAIVMLVVLAVFKNNETWAMLTLGVLGGVQFGRVVRAATLSVRNALYVRAARVGGLRTWTIMRRHILPALAGPVIVQVTLFSGAAVMLETALGFLELGSREATWGTMVAEASKNLSRHPWLLVPSGALIIVYMLAAGTLGDAVRDVTTERGTGTLPTLGRATYRRAVDTGAENADGQAEESAALLVVRDLTVAFPVDGVLTPVVTDVSFQIGTGEAVGLVGESGCGKSVSALAVLGMTPPTAALTGRIRFEGRDVLGASARDLAAIRGRRIGWVSQDPFGAFDPTFTIGAQLAEAVRATAGTTRPVARRRAVELLEAVRFAEPREVARSYPHQLSGGMAQRAGIAAALAGDPALLIADEPTTALDVTVQAEILDLLRELGARGTAVLLVTHDWGVLADVCSRAVVMYAGQIVEDAPVDEIVDAPRHPYTAALLRANPYHAAPRQPLPAIDGAVPAPGSWPHGCRFSPRCPQATIECERGPVALHQVASGRTTRCVHADQLSAVSHV